MPSDVGSKSLAGNQKQNFNLCQPDPIVLDKMEPSAPLLSSDAGVSQQEVLYEDVGNGIKQNWSKNIST